MKILYILSSSSYKRFHIVLADEEFEQAREQLLKTSVGFFYSSLSHYKEYFEKIHKRKTHSHNS